jgi:hypothetical protein
MSTSPPISESAGNGAQQVSLPQTVQLTVDEIIPYWRNPRRIPEEAVSAVAASIRDYGYQQPIVVDANNTIVIGHTRYAALRRLRIDTPVSCIKLVGLSQEKVKQLRVLDNRVAEYTSWDFEQLMAELSELDRDLMKVYFPEAAAPEDDGPDLDLDLETPRPLPWETADAVPAEFVCPTCFHSWTMQITADAVRSGVLEVTA